MTPDDKKELQGHIRAISEILYRNTSQEQLQTFESIEITVRETMLTEVTPQVGEFFLTEEKNPKKAGQEKSKAV